MRVFAWLMVLVMSPMVSAADGDDQQWPTQDGPVTVVWQSPDDYRDVRASSGRQDRYENHVFATLGKEFQKRLQPTLAEGETLTIVVTDLDLAGDVRPSFGATANDIRVVKSIYPPGISFQWTLNDRDGKAIASDTVEIRELNFENTASRMRYQSEALHYELRMIERWVDNDLPETLASR
ncbi:MULTISPECIES: DUF3016 domain-containing protein [Ferrimonas]|uniref:DUF3016 domain-containing protein n=1 Tax=Ferrimonas TaxID=44011 RepID=UPI0003F7CFA3|nr:MULTISPECIES: DUF3016 domain-containing protein [Ferrimonas]USD37119.1 DUF3016 domain-containing protein [Ferrimonas sp. SCSIO 43195]